MMDWLLVKITRCLQIDPARGGMYAPWYQLHVLAPRIMLLPGYRSWPGIPRTTRMAGLLSRTSSLSQLYRVREGCDNIP